MDKGYEKLPPRFADLEKSYSDAQKTVTTEDKGNGDLIRKTEWANGMREYTTFRRPKKCFTIPDLPFLYANSSRSGKIDA